MEFERFASDPVSRRRFFHASGVATAEAVDTSMRLGYGLPLGPLAALSVWVNSLGAEAITPSSINTPSRPAGCEATSKNTAGMALGIAARILTTACPLDQLPISSAKSIPYRKAGRFFPAPAPLPRWAT